MKRSLNDHFLVFTSEESPAALTDDGSKTDVPGSTQASKAAAQKSRKKREDDEEVQIEVTAKLGGIGVTVTSVEGDLSHVVVGGRYRPFDS